MEKERLYRVTDGSYSVRLGTSYGDLMYHENIVSGKKYKIIAKNCVLPDNDEGRTNDTIVMNIKSKEIHFVKSDFLAPIDCPHGRKIINRCPCCWCCPCCNLTDEG